VSFKTLYAQRQSMPFHVKRTQILKLAQEISGKEAMLLCTGKLTIDVLRGLYISVDDTSQLNLDFAKGKNLIIFARQNNRCWRRMVIMKESMHLFDSAPESTSTADRFGSLIDDLIVRSPEKPTLEMRSEIFAMWKAVSLFVPEADRAEIAQDRANGKLHDKNDIADKIKMPLQWVPALFGPNYKDILQILLQENVV